MASRFFEGIKLDKKAALDFVRFFGFKNALVIVGKNGMLFLLLGFLNRP